MKKREPGEMESEVRYYCRVFPDTFDKAEGSYIYTRDGRPFLDFFSAAGSLNYGHNNPAIHGAVIAYLQRNGIISALDMNTSVKIRFMELFDELILRPRGMRFKFQFPGPTGTNAMEAAIKLARKVAGRSNIFSFFGAFHGMSAGSLSATGNLRARAAAGTELHGATFMPFPEGFMSGFDTLAYMEEVLDDTHSGIEKPAAVLVETVQAEGGVNVAPPDWLARLREICTKRDILLVCDDIQVGCGRTGRFFSFEHAGIVPDIVVLSKSLSGLGLPLSLVLMREDLDAWRPGEHTGTFRSNGLSLAGATAALEAFWATPDLMSSVAEKQQLMGEYIFEEIAQYSANVTARGMGMIRGLRFEGAEGGELAAKVARRCYELGLIVEKAGRNDCVVKLLPALTIEKDDLLKGLGILKQAVTEVVR